MKKALKRLHLRQGDILVVSDAETLNRLKRCGAQPPPGVKSIPVVLAPEGIERVPLEKLKELVARKGEIRWQRKRRNKS